MNYSTDIWGHIQPCDGFGAPAGYDDCAFGGISTQQPLIESGVTRSILNPDAGHGYGFRYNPNAANDYAEFEIGNVCNSKHKVVVATRIRIGTGSNLMFWFGFSPSWANLWYPVVRAVDSDFVGFSFDSINHGDVNFMAHSAKGATGIGTTVDTGVAAANFDDRLAIVWDKEQTCTLVVGENTIVHQFDYSGADDFPRGNDDGFPSWYIFSTCLWGSIAGSQFDWFGTIYRNYLANPWVPPTIPGGETYIVDPSGVFIADPGGDLLVEP